MLYFALLAYVSNVVFNLFFPLDKSPPKESDKKKKKKLDIKDVFNNEDETDNGLQAKKRKLVPLGKLIYDDSYRFVVDINFNDALC